MELKEELKQHLVKQQEKDRLARVEVNSKLQKSIIYTDGNDKSNIATINALKSEGVPFIEKKVSENWDEWKEVMSTTNINNLPTAFVNGEYLVIKRDFQNPQQLIGALNHLAGPNFKNPSVESKIIEHMKTHTYNLNQRLLNLEKRFTPIAQFISNLQQELAEEEETNTETNTETKVGGCNQKTIDA